MRKQGEIEAQAAREQGREVRARNQEEAGSHRKRRSAEIHQVEQSRQWGRQREDIHPAEVLERLAIVEAKNRQGQHSHLPFQMPTLIVRSAHYVFAC